MRLGVESKGPELRDGWLLPKRIELGLVTLRIGRYVFVGPLEDVMRQLLDINVDL